MASAALLGINLVLLLAGQAPESVNYVSLGCWTDTADVAIPTLEGADPRLDGSHAARSNAIEKCYQVARSRGFTVFAVQDGGRCAGSADGHNTYNKHGPSTDCGTDGQGGPWANEVYQITDVDDCIPGACDNGGTCVDGDSTYSCVCPPGFKGERCQTAPCSEDYDPPLNGAKACTLTDDTTGAMFCTVFCHDDKEFALAPAQVYTCQADGGWFADSDPVVGQSSPWPDCTGRYRPGRPHLLGSVHYFSGTDCLSSMSEIISNFHQLFSQLSSSQPGGSVPAQLQNVEVECGGTA
ncbi:uncharacterized protein LOC144928887 [Branchiostoma floridae x Branchiostoma belcheri]